jgi:hypothetical protein
MGLDIAAARRRRVGAGDDRQAQRRQLRQHRLDRFDQRRRDDDGLGAAVAEDVGILRRREQRVERDRHDAGADRAEEGDRVVDAVEHQHNDTAFLPQPETHEAAREP